MLGRWSLIPVLAVGLCLWTKWRTRQCESKIEKDKLDQLGRKTRHQLRALKCKSSLKGEGHLVASRSSSSACDQKQRRPGDRLGGIPGAATANRGEHLSPNAANGNVSDEPKDALGSELWAWLGGVAIPRVCGADRPRSRAAGGEGGGGAGEWRGAFTNRMGNLPRRNAFKTARGKVYLRSGNRKPRGARGGIEAPTEGILESVREEDEGSTGA